MSDDGGNRPIPAWAPPAWPQSASPPSAWPPPALPAPAVYLAPDPTPWKGAPRQAIDAARNGRQLRIPSWGIPDSLISQVVTIVVTFGFVAAFYAVTPNEPAFNIAAIFASLFVQWSVMAGWPLIVSYWRGNGPRLDYGFSLSWRDIAPGLLGGIVCLVGAAVVAGISTAIFGHLSSNAGKVVDDLSNYSVAAFIFTTLGVIGAPVVEELAFRGLLWSALAKRGLNGWWCTGISAALFATVHLEFTRFFVLFAAGLVLGGLRQFTRRVGPGIIAHMGLNAIAFIGGFVFLH